MSLSHLPTLGDVQRKRRAKPKHAMISRLDERQAKKTVADKAERQARAAVWKRARGRCERCGQRVTRDLNSLTVGHVHHVRKRSQGGTWDVANLILLCHHDHNLMHLGTRVNR